MQQNQNMRMNGQVAEVTQDKAESYVCQAEENLKVLRDECDATHKSLAFRAAEREELKIELDIERERNRQEVRVKGDDVRSNVVRVFIREEYEIEGAWFLELVMNVLAIRRDSHVVETRRISKN